jgi:hypothetical protein
MFTHQLLSSTIIQTARENPQDGVKFPSTNRRIRGIDHWNEALIKKGGGDVYGIGEWFWFR